MPRIHNGTRIVCSTNSVGKTISTCQKIKLNPYFISLTKTNSKWIKDLHMTPETVKLLEEDIREKLCDIDPGNDFMDTTPRAQVTKISKIILN